VALVAAAVCGAFGGRAVAAESPRFAVVNVEQVLDRLLSWREVVGRLDAREAEIRTALAGREKEVDRLRAELRYFHPGSRDHERRRAEVAALEQNLAAEHRRLYTDLAEDRKRAAAATRAAVVEAARAHALAHGFDFVLDARAVLYVADAHDVSLEVAFDLNERYKEARKEREEDIREDDGEADEE